VIDRAILRWPGDCYMHVIMELRQTILPPRPTTTLYVYALLVPLWVRTANVVHRVFDGAARLFSVTP
jgi:hypothetical protein